MLSLQRSVGALALWGALACWIGVPSPSAAQAPDPSDADARLHFRLGEAQYALGHFHEAAIEFEQAHALSRRPELLYNIYLSHRDAGEIEAAVLALRQYLVEVPGTERGPELRARLVVLEAQVAERAAMRGGGTEPSTPNETATTNTAASETETSEAATSEITTTAVAPPMSEPRGSHPSPVGWVFVGIGAAALVAAAVTGGIAGSQFAALEARCGPDRTCPPGYEAERDTGRTLASATDGLLIAGGVVALTGVILLFVLQEEDASSDATVSAGCGPLGCSGAVTVPF